VKCQPLANPRFVAQGAAWKAKYRRGTAIRSARIDEGEAPPTSAENPSNPVWIVGKEGRPPVEGEIVMNTDVSLKDAPAPRDANSGSSWFFKSGWASTYFRPVPEGQVFTCTSPWMFGRSREYRLSDAQAEQLVARFGRAFAKVIYVMAGGIGLAIVTGLGFLARGPVVAGSAVAAVTVILIGVCLGLVYRAAGSVLAGLSWTSVPRAPYSLTGNLKKTNALMMMLPTWALAAGTAVTLISVAAILIAPFVSGKTELDVVSLASKLATSFMFGRALVTKLKARSAFPADRHSPGPGSV
jgi:hypothetical protein